MFDTWRFLGNPSGYVATAALIALTGLSVPVARDADAGRAGFPVRDDGACIHALFDEPSSYSVGETRSSPYGGAIAVGDLDGIHGPDLAVARFSKSAAVLLNRGDGTFDPAVTHFLNAPFGTVTSVSIGNLDRMPRPELVMTTAPYCDAESVGGHGIENSAVWVLRNRGHGTFDEATAYELPGSGFSGLYSVAIGDLDGMHGPDLAVTGAQVGHSFTCFRRGSTGVWVLFNRGDGTFAAATTYDVYPEAWATSVAIRDLDGVHGPDLAVTGNSNCGRSGCSESKVLILLNRGDGTFAAPMTYELDVDLGRNNPASVATEDLDGLDGPDIVVADSSSGEVSVLLNQGDGTFGAAATYYVGQSPRYQSPRSVRIGDLDGIDGPDLAVARFDSHDVVVLLNEGDGTFSEPVAYAAGYLRYPSALGIADLDGIRGLDLAVSNWSSSRGVAVLTNRCESGPRACPDDDGDGVVRLCHVPAGRSRWARTITVPAWVSRAHLAHGDRCGPCVRSVSSDSFFSD